MAQSVTQKARSKSFCGAAYGLRVRSQTRPEGEGVNPMGDSTSERRSKRRLEQGEPFNPYGLLGPQIAIMRRRDLTDTAKVAYLRLVIFAGKNGRCNPGNDSLAREINRTPRRAQSAVELLEKKQLIRRHISGGRKHTNEITFLWQPEFECGFENTTPASGFDSENHDSGVTVTSKTTTPASGFSVSNDDAQDVVSLETTTPASEKLRRQRHPNPKENPYKKSKLSIDLSDWPQSVEMMRSLATNQDWHISDNLLRKVIAAAALEIPPDYDPDAALAESVYVAECQRGPGLWLQIIGDQVRRALQAGYLECYRRSTRAAG